MTINVNTLMIILYAIGGLMLVLLIILGVVYTNMKVKEKGIEKKQALNTKDADGKTSKIKQYTVESVFDFMEFDKIEDNMIIQRNGNKYLMVVECQGINYDLMSEPEKISVEEGFIQFLNTLTGPVQLYVQTRTINLADSIQSYKQKVDVVEAQYAKQQMKYQQLLESGQYTDQQIKQEYYELIKQKNLAEYGKDIISNTQKMSLNKNILNKKYYLVLSYFPTEIGENFDKEEIKDMAFSELYTKSQSMIRALSISGVIGKILTSTQLVDLLYVAYNRDDSEIYGIDKAMKARYDELYSTAPDYMDKKIKILDEEINKKAYDLANQKVIEAQSDKEKLYAEKQDNMDDIIGNLAKLIIEENSSSIGRENADIAKEKIDKEKIDKEKIDKEKSRKEK